MRKTIDALLAKAGYRKAPSMGEFPPDFEPAEIEIIRKVRPYTMTSPERILSLIKAVRHVVLNDIPGDIVECGVWKGGSMMAAILTMLAMNRSDRDIYLFDTFEGMTEPTGDDLSFRGEAAGDLLQQREKDEQAAIWAFSPLDKVKENILSLGYDPGRIHFVKGRVEDTVPRSAPDRIALLRLDTDWYESTAHELKHFYPRLSSRGILIIDDYGHWQGSRKATDEYLMEHKLPLFLSRIDYTGRIAVKP